MSPESRQQTVIERPAPGGHVPAGHGQEWVREPGQGFSLRRRQGPWRDALLRRLLALADAGTALLVCASFVLFAGGSVDKAFWASVFVPAWVLLAKLHGLYDRDQRTLRHLTVDELPSILVWAMSSVAATGLFLWMMPAGPLTIGAAVRGWVLAVVAGLTLRALARSLWRRIVPRERTLVIGSGPLADATRRKLELFPDIHIEVVDQREDFDPPDEELPPDALDVDRVILASQSLDEALIAHVLELCREERIKLSVVPPARGMFGTAVILNHVADLPVVEYNTWDVPRSTLFLKRTLDVVLSSIALALLAPLFLLIAIAIKLESRGPVIFKQTRAGVGGRPFPMRKFRTMVADAEQRLPDLVPFDKLDDPMFKLPNDPRVTRVGRLLRRTSIDELPQLFNVLRGQMSLVGPRPEQVDLVERYLPEHRFRLSVKPGLTGPMQVFGRGKLTFEERLAVEREYIENLSLRRDLRILGLTFSAVLDGKGAF